jgi:hypothetical protein
VRGRQAAHVLTGWLTFSFIAADAPFGYIG